MRLVRHVHGRILCTRSLILLGIVVFVSSLPSLALAQSPDAPAAPSPQATQTTQPAASAAPAPAVQPGQLAAPQEPQSPGSISGVVVDPAGAVVARAHVQLTRDARTGAQEALTDENGQFSFTDAAPGPFEITITSEGFAPRSVTGTLYSGENFSAPQIGLSIAANVTEVHVGLTRTEMADAQLKEQEKQRVLGIIPNFYVSYDPDAAPLNSRQKFQLAWKTTVDPVTFVINGMVAGVQQAQNQFAGYGQGAQGYAKRYGASYVGFVSGTFIGSAILPSVFKQDPRYFYKGTGTTKSRVLYAISSAVMCKGDNGHWQPNYSSIIGSMASGGISYFYYPPGDRNIAELTVESTLIGIGETAAANIFQEFVIRKFTPGLSSHDPSKAQTALGKVSSVFLHDSASD
jgi:hypothetical protein